MPDGLERPTPRSMATTALGEVSLADVRDAIDRDETVPAWKRAQWKSALKRLGEFLGRDLAAMPARLRALQPALRGLHHAQLGITKARLRNIKSDLRAALGHCGHIIPGLGKDQELAPAWMALHDRLTEVRHRRGLIRFFRFCSFRGIGPEDVDDDAVTAFLEAVIESGSVTKPKNLHRSVCRFWNDCVENIAGWPRCPVTVPDNRPARKTLSWDAFTDALRSDVAAHLDWLAGKDLLAEDGPARPCKPATLERRREYIRLAASAAVASGIDIKALNSLADLVRPETVKRILDVYLARYDDEPTTFIIDLAERLRDIARRWTDLPKTEIAALDRMCRRLGKHRRLGMTDKNLAVIRKVRDPAEWAELMALPERLMDEAMAARNALHKAAIKAQMALAIRLLSVAPMRIANLASLSLETNVIQTGGLEGRYHLAIPDHDVKNGVPLEYPLPESVSDMLALYISMFRNRVKGSNTEWLFPGENGHKDPKTLSGQIKDIIAKEIGLKITPQQFRHAAAAILLKAHPGNYELVRRVLGHKSLQTTINFYIGLENWDAAQQYAKLVLNEPDDDDADQID